ncbi:MAG: COP23 domain-containing protein [Xenococcaceae cyanobacterium MO_188.B29]|nr:COP23 domain-containing protein [Xenococcaceae cyanobacterium MO_188.B29]
MKNLPLVQLSLAMATILGGILALAELTSAQTSSSTNQYRCEEVNGEPTTVVYTPQKRIAMIVWRSKYFGSQWNPRKRCEEVSRRFQYHQNQKNLRYITTGLSNGYNIICVANRNLTCRADGILITLESKDDPKQVANELFSVGQKEGSSPLSRSAGSGKFLLNFEKYLQEHPPIEEVPHSSEQRDDIIDLCTPGRPFCSQ